MNILRQPNRQNLALLRMIQFAAVKNRITMTQMVNLYNSQGRNTNSHPAVYINILLCKQNKYLDHVGYNVYQITPKGKKVLEASCNR